LETPEVSALGFGYMKIDLGFRDALRNEDGITLMHQAAHRRESDIGQELMSQRAGRTG
jgi:hypothetical protein